MGVSRKRWISVVLLLAASAQHCFAGQRTAGTGETGSCRVEVIEGEVASGQSFERAIGNGLRIKLEAIASGWIVRVLPVGAYEEHDYAELANPPYRSVSPLLIGTDFSFRAQDALAWNPRRFRFAADRASFQELLAVYKEDPPISRPATTADGAKRRDVESRLAMLVGRAPEGELTILDAHLVPGTGDQSKGAAMVATHLNLSARQVDQPAGGRATPLGRLDWLRFRIRLDLPKGFRPEPSLPLERRGCL
jgi:hypothetical protein